MQPVGRPVWSVIGPVPPDRPQLLAADGAPDILTPPYVVPTEELLPFGGHDGIRDGGRDLVDLSPEIKQGREGDHHDDDQN